MKISCMFLAVLLQRATTYAKQGEFCKFVERGVPNATEIGSDVILRDVTSLCGGNQLRTVCMFKCTKLESCQGFVVEKNRCILAGNATLPGKMVSLQNIVGTKMFWKENVAGIN